MAHTEPDAHDHAPGHAHADAPRHDHARHADHHGHAHDPAAVATPGPSLLRMSAVRRLAGAGALSALIWAGVRWAIT